jgi:hypothetical protein
MDTDYAMPVPMHRLFITLDPRCDLPLPFRYPVKQATELTAENEIPYQLRKERRLSSFKKLPFEVQERIYSYLNIERWISPNLGFRNFNEAVSWTYLQFC